MRRGGNRYGCATAPLPIPLPGCRSKAAAAPATRSARRYCEPPCSLFLEQGYHRATLNEVAERLNITKPALYNYFRGKEEILFECWALGQERVDEFIAGINAAGGDRA